MRKGIERLEITFLRCVFEDFEKYILYLVEGKK